MQISDEMVEAFGNAFWSVNAASKIDGQREHIRSALEAALSTDAEPVAWQPRYKQEVIDHLRTVSDGVSEYAMTVFPTKEQAEKYGHGSHDVRPLYAEPVKSAPAVAVKELQWDEDGDNLKARMGDREWMINVTSDGKTWAGSTRPFVFGRNLTWGSVPNCLMVSLEEAKAACQADCQSRYVALSAQVQDVAVDGADIGRCIRSLSVEHPLKWAEAEKTPILRGWFVGQVMKHFDGKPDEKLVRELIDIVFAIYPASPASKHGDAE